MKHTIWRLEHNNNLDSSRIQTYVFPRLLSGITVFLWAAFGTFFRFRVHAAISEVCPAGLLSAIGGKKRRNIITLGQYKHMFSLYHYHYKIIKRWRPHTAGHLCVLGFLGQHSYLDNSRLPGWARLLGNMVKWWNNPLNYFRTIASTVHFVPWNFPVCAFALHSFSLCSSVQKQKLVLPDLDQINN